MIKAIFFDLDMCILDTHSLSGPFFQPVLDVLHASDLSSELKQKVENELWTTSLDDTARLYNLPASLASAMRVVYMHIKVPDGIRTFGDEGCIAELPVIKILVTSGFSAFQQSKVDMLGIRGMFDEVIIDSLDEPSERKGKKMIFQELMEKYVVGKDEVLVVGDNPHSELRASQELGVRSVQTVRPTVVKWDEADFHIETLCELKGML